MENWTMTRGDTLSFGVELYADKEATETFTQDLSTATFTINRNNVAVVEKSIGDGVTKKSVGVYVVMVAPEDTADLNSGEYEYKFTVTVNGDAFTLLRGTLTLE